MLLNVSPVILNIWYCYLLFFCVVFRVCYWCIGIILAWLLVHGRAASLVSAAWYHYVVKRDIILTDQNNDALLYGRDAKWSKTPEKSRVIWILSVKKKSLDSFYNVMLCAKIFIHFQPKCWYSEPDEHKRWWIMGKYYDDMSIFSKKYKATHFTVCFQILESRYIFYGSVLPHLTNHTFFFKLTLKNCRQKKRCLLLSYLATQLRQLQWRHKWEILDGQKKRGRTVNLILKIHVEYFVAMYRNRSPQSNILSFSPSLS